MGRAARSDEGRTTGGAVGGGLGPGESMEKDSRRAQGEGEKWHGGGAAGCTGSELLYESGDGQG